MEPNHLSTQKERPSFGAIMLVIISIVAVFILAVVVWPNWYDSKHPQPKDECRNTTKEVQTIRKIDGDVDSIETETVYGCQYSDGTFIPAPDAQ